MAIMPILPVTFDALQAVALGDGFRDGQILEARITALLSDKLARIEINGQPLVVTMTKPLPVGVALTLKVERDAGQLKLIAQGPAREMPEIRIADMPEARVRDMLGAQLRDMPESRARDLLRGLIRAMPEAQLKEMPEARTSDKLDAWIKDMPEARVRDMLRAQVRDMPEALARDVLAIRLRDMAAASIRTAEPQRPAYNSPEPVKAAMAKIQAMTVEAMLDEGSTAEPSLTQILASMARPQTEVAPLLPPRVPPAASNSPPPATPGAAGQQAPEDGDGVAYRIETPEFRQVHVAPESQAAAARPERTAIFSVDIPIFLPGNDVPLRLNVTRDEEEADRADDEPRSPYWTVRFAAEAGQLGMVHAAISLIDGHIGVLLRAEREATAERFTEHVSQLRDALHASDLKLDGVTVSQGGPLGDR